MPFTSQEEVIPSEVFKMDRVEILKTLPQQLASHKKADVTHKREYIDNNIAALRHGWEASKPQRVLDYSAAKKGVYYSDRMGAYYSSLHKVRSWKEKSTFEILSVNFFIKLSDTFQQVLCDTKVLYETVPWTRYHLLFDRKMKRWYKTATFCWRY